jgi:hypothetical protein
MISLTNNKFPLPFKGKGNVIDCAVWAEAFHDGRTNLWHEILTSLHKNFDISTQRFWLPVLPCPNKDNPQFSKTFMGFLYFILTVIFLYLPVL